jgi:hypothetical protein
MGALVTYRVMAGLRPGHPRLAFLLVTIKTWMPGTRPGMTKQKGPGKTGAFDLEKRQ